jgi:hypothetical protein
MPTFQPELEDARTTWKWLHPRTQQRIEEALLANTAVKAGLAQLKASPNDTTVRSNLVNVVALRTGNCIGQSALQMHLDPEDDSKSAYKALPSGTEAAIAQAVSGDAKVKNDPVDDFLRISIRYTGNCIGQAVTAEAQNAGKALAWLIGHIP